jgi:hypothetical protein
LQVFLFVVMIRRGGMKVFQILLVILTAQGICRGADEAPRAQDQRKANIASTISAGAFNALVVSGDVASGFLLRNAVTSDTSVSARAICGGIGILCMGLRGSEILKGTEAKSTPEKAHALGKQLVANSAGYGSAWIADKLNEDPVIRETIARGIAGFLYVIGGGNSAVLRKVAQLW